MAKRRSGGSGWLTWVLVAFGIAATPVALRVAGVLALSGPVALTALFPWAELVKAPMTSVGADMANTFEQWLMYLQFPVYGLMIATISRTRSFFLGLVSVAFLHAVCVAGAIGMGYLHL